LDGRGGYRPRRSRGLLSPPGGCQEQEHCGGVEEKRHGQNEIAKHVLVSRADQHGQILHRTKIGLDDATLALHSGLLDLQIGEGLRLDRELVGKVVALGLSSLVVRGAEL